MMNKIIKETVRFFIIFLLVYAIGSYFSGSFNWTNVLIVSVVAGIFYGIFRGLLLRFQNK